ncbi:hypothetical protein D9M73_220240 [compost metagenome]
MKVTRLTVNGSPPLTNGKALSPDICCQAAVNLCARTPRVNMALKLRLSMLPARSAPSLRLSK